MQAVRSRHLPKSMREAEEARQRLAFEELLVLQLRLLLQRTSIQCAPCPCLSSPADCGHLAPMRCQLRSEDVAREMPPGKLPGSGDLRCHLCTLLLHIWHESSGYNFEH